jgi:hypothetical protein
MLEWKWVVGEWTVTGFTPAINSTGWRKIGTYFLSPYGPPFKYRMWHRDNKDWVRGTMDHPANIEEAKLCLMTMLRME